MAKPRPFHVTDVSIVREVLHECEPGFDARIEGNETMRIGSTRELIEKSVEAGATSPD